jgi:hypothetical protein
MNTIENIIPFSKESKERTEDPVKHDKPCSQCSKTREKLLKKIKRANEIDEMMTFSKNLKLR